MKTRNGDGAAPQCQEAITSGCGGTDRYTSACTVYCWTVCETPDSRPGPPRVIHVHTSSDWRVACEESTNGWDRND
jgi:hypothetical protein